MSQPYIAEIRMVGFNFAPNGWAFCDGSLLPISQYETLFTLIGTTYGGDGVNTFGLPNLQGRVPIHQGSNSGNSYVIGQSFGVENVTLITQEMPLHTHQVPCAASGNASDPTNAVFGGDTTAAVYANADGSTQLSNAFLSTTGNSQAHNNVMPFQVINFVISLFGIFPSQT
jgi:microcystin-dependent protein